MDPLRKLGEVTERLDIIKGHVTAVTAARDDAIREALAAGVPVSGIVRAAGLTRARVYQIRDGRR